MTRFFVNRSFGIQVRESERDKRKCHFKSGLTDKHKRHKRRQSSRGQKVRVRHPGRGAEVPRFRKEGSQFGSGGRSGWLGGVGAVRKYSSRFFPLFIYISILRVRVEVAIGLRFLCQDNLVASSTSGQDVYCTNGWVEYFIISVFRKCWNL